MKKVSYPRGMIINGFMMLVATLPVVIFVELYRLERFN